MVWPHAAPGRFVPPRHGPECHQRLRYSCRPCGGGPLDTPQGFQPLHLQASLQPLQVPGLSSPLLSQPSSSSLPLFIKPLLTLSSLHCCLLSHPHPGVLGTTGAPRGLTARLCPGGTPNPEEMDLDREIPKLVRCGIGQREMTVAAQRRVKASAGAGWKASWGRSYWTWVWDKTKKILKQKAG